jgi:hypothetical protein
LATFDFSCQHRYAALFINVNSGTEISGATLCAPAFVALGKGRGGIGEYKQACAQDLDEDAAIEPEIVFNPLDGFLVVVCDDGGLVFHTAARCIALRIWG